jgi:GNAT superfamily N-acetyltransferase
MLNIRTFQPKDEPAVVDLWRRCDLLRPQNDPHRDIARKMRIRPDLFFVGESEGRLVATVMAGYEGHRGSVNYLAVCPTVQRRGFGCEMMAHVERRLRLEGCPKINLNVRTSNVAVSGFYLALGYLRDDVVSLGKRLIHDTAGGQALGAPADAASPEAVVQRQLDAFNARDVEAIAATYADHAQQFEHPNTLLASGLAELRRRWTVRFQEPILHARLLSRIVMGPLVVDHEEVTRTFPEGPGRVEVLCTYEVQGGRITTAWFAFGPRILDPR